jgi:lysophospholipase L1-like esterase
VRELFVVPLFCVLAGCSDDVQPATDTTPEPVPPPALSQWFAGGITGKTICFVGDSTTSNATALFDGLDKYSADGQPLHGVGAILNYGENGASLYAFLANQVVHGIDATLAANADLYVIGYGINDVRLGNTTEDQLVAMLTDTVDRIRAEVPNADIVLRMPNSLLTTDVNGYHYVQPNESAQAYSTLLHDAYLRLENRWSNVVVLDTQDIVFGTESLPSSPFMTDQLHPSADGYVALAQALVALIGVPP